MDVEHNKNNNFEKDYILKKKFTFCLFLLVLLMTIQIYLPTHLLQLTKIYSFINILHTCAYFEEEDF